MVTISAPRSSPQTRVAFNAALVRAAGLADVTHVAIDIDDRSRSAVFVACGESSREIPKDAKFPLGRDGGQKTNKTAGRAIYVNRNKAADLVAGKYPAEFQNSRGGIRVTIHLDPKGTSYRSMEDVPGSIGGVYRLLDRKGHTIDIGMSESDVRGRVRTKWSNEPDAEEAIVYRLDSKRDCLHWERIFHRRHQKESGGALPKHCEAIGPGCGCAKCND